VYCVMKSQAHKSDLVFGPLGLIAEDPFAGYPWTTDLAGTGLAAPHRSESPAMPANHGGVLHDDEGARPRRPESPKCHPEEAILESQTTPWGRSLVNGQLLSQGGVLLGQGCQPRLQRPPVSAFWGIPVGDCHRQGSRLLCRPGQALGVREDDRSRRLCDRAPVEHRPRRLKHRRCSHPSGLPAGQLTEMNQ